MATHRKGEDAQSRSDQTPRCSTSEMHRQLARRSGGYRAARRQSEYELKQWIRRFRGAGLRLPIVRIPVVVHVVYNTTAQNITDAQIHSQIAVLNQDYRRLNADAAGVPPPFKPVVADARIEFALAVRAPDCTPTTGITRTQTTTTLFTYSAASEFLLKSDAPPTGGHAPWPRDRYLNIWVCNHVWPGYARYPGAPAHLDGVIVWHRAFGTTGTARWPWDLGRTATHEIGHWLNLLHLWGDDDDPNAPCTRSDEVADTPVQREDNISCPAFPHVSCNNGPNGDMFMNYMDYVDDACMFMFTAGQAERMHATLQTTRSSIMSSDGLIPPSPGGRPDLWSRNTIYDNGTEPDPTPQPMFISDDIWVRHGNDGLLNDEHQNPRYLASGRPNHVYVRVRNRGCPGGLQEGLLRVYWAKAALSVSASWPGPWDGSVNVPAPMGGLIGSAVLSVNSGDEEIYEFPWSPPNPALYAGLGGKGFFGLLARIETASAAPYGMTYPETANLEANVRKNNNVVCKCVSVMQAASPAWVGHLMIGTFVNDDSVASIVFQAPEGEASMFDLGAVKARFGAKLHERWVRAGRKSSGTKLLPDGQIVITRPGARLESVPLSAGELDGLELRVEPFDAVAAGARAFALDAIQLDEKGEFAGGHRFYLKTGPRPGEYEWDDNVGLFDGVTWRSA